MNDPQLTTQIKTQVLNQYLECITIKRLRLLKIERICSSFKSCSLMNKDASHCKGTTVGFG